MHDPTHLITMAGITVVAFAATNLDNLALLIAWSASRVLSTTRLFLGYSAGMLCILLITVLLNALSGSIPVEYLGYLGVIPVLVGIRSLGLLLRQHDAGSITSPAAGSIAAVASTQVANGMDTVLTFAPLLAETASAGDYVILTVFAIAATSWFGLACWLGRQAARLPLMTRYGQWLAPVVMIAVGLYIFDNTSTDLLPGN